MIQIRYIVNNVEEAITFYTSRLGFKLEMHTAGSFAMLSHENLRLVLSVPNSSSAGGQPMPDGSQQSPGGWNRFSIEVSDISNFVEKLKQEGVHLRSNIVTGKGGKQVIMDDPSGNPIKLLNQFWSKLKNKSCRSLKPVLPGRLL